MRYKVVMWDDDPAFVARVEQFVRKSMWNTQFVCRICTHMDDVRAAIAQWGAHLLMTTDAYDMHVPCSVLRWSDHQRADAVDRYTPMPQLMQRWLHACTTTEHTPRRASFVVAVWGVCGGAGTSLIAGHIARQFVHYGTPSFFCSTEEVDVSCGTAADVVHDVSDWLYAYKVRKQRVHERVSHVRMHRFDAHVSWREWASVDKEEASFLIDEASECIDGVVVVDAGARANAFSQAVWHRADVLVVVVPAGVVGTARLAHWRTQWPIPEHVHVVTVRNKCLHPSEQRQEVALPYVPEWKQCPEEDDIGFRRAIDGLVEEVHKRWICSRIHM
jgi:hypothetical protein